ncbi:hypothetical protein BDW22DRAFT_709324 [Trametopsis cervina]|nr:hypothetical protein BDW22DRAFT_709324 [Trametopsis cervina]
MKPPRRFDGLVGKIKPFPTHDAKPRSTQSHRYICTRQTSSVQNLRRRSAWTTHARGRVKTRTRHGLFRVGRFHVLLQQLPEVSETCPRSDCGRWANMSTVRARKHVSVDSLLMPLRSEFHSAVYMSTLRSRVDHNPIKSSVNLLVVASAFAGLLQSHINIRPAIPISYLYGLITVAARTVACVRFYCRYRGLFDTLSHIYISTRQLLETSLVPDICQASISSHLCSRLLRNLTTFLVPAVVALVIHGVLVRRTLQLARLTFKSLDLWYKRSHLYKVRSVDTNS